MNEQTENAESTEPRGQSVAELVRSQRDLYRSLHRLAERQRRLIAADDPSALLSLLSQRQRITQSLVELGQRLAATGWDLLGLYGQLHPHSKYAFLRGRIERYCQVSVAKTIAGGTSEIMRAIIAIRGLGLPKG